MATRYVRSTDGNNADSGATWVLAKATLAGADAIDVGGDLICASQVHSESTAAGVTLAWAGSPTAPTRIVCGNDAAEPPTAVAATAVMATTGASTIIINGNISCSGIIFKAGSAGNAASLALCNTAGQIQQYRNCEFWLNNTNSLSLLGIANQPGATVRLRDCSLRFGAATQGITISGSLHWNGGGAVAGTTSPNEIFKTYGSNGGGGPILVENVDFSGFATTVDLSSNTNGTRWPLVFRNCKMPSGWTGRLISASYSTVGRAEAYNVSDGSVNYKLRIEDFCGTVTDDAQFRTGGASDGVTAIGWKMESNGNAVYPSQPLASPEIVRWFPGTAAEIAAWSPGASVTVTVEVMCNVAAPLNDNELWLEVNDLGTASYTLGVFASDAAADVLTAGAAQTASTITGWDSANLSARANTTAYVVGNRFKLASNPDRVFYCTTAGTSAGSEPAGYASAVDGGSVTDNTAVFRAGTRQKLVVTVTPRLKGFLHARVMLAKANTQVFVDPKPYVA